ncbi:RloB family protein [Chitinophaga filiformis]|uniref:RloB-like protein n=1 Tax=Chitinophaga filiformis TaxID=104663 RepID=A0A1G7MH31_CHIFI|nr:RloB family protein [Chitinophaga filiformis]SDF60993.1 RloB-like protein [Chitinophaga filiformis]
MAGHINPWDVKTDDARKEDTINLYIIFCEDAVSEPVYFRSFQNDNLKINAIPNQRKGKLNLEATVTQCKKDGLIEFAENGYRIKDDRTENIWCVYDRDFEHADLAMVQPAKNTAWDLAIQTASTAGLKLAWSNDAFELWILLHFEEIAPGQPVHRDYIYERLTEIFKAIQPRDAALDAIIKHPKFGYKDSFKHLNAFYTHILPLLKGKTNEALHRAATLAAYHNGNTTFYERNPCTLVHTLVTELLANGGL